jgi:8-oxo-dGTP pyrophosphatase MutT (NUDIX family)
VRIEFLVAQPVTPLPASTVVLVRPDRHGCAEVFLNRRPETMETYAGVYVFPGGRVEQHDSSQEMLKLTRGVLPSEARSALESELEAEVCLGHWVAAVRELFEETGIHFFVNAATLSFDENEIARRLASKRQALQEGEINLSSLLATEQLTCDLSQLRYFFHRVTPDHYKIRFDTRFYVAALPKNQTPLPSSEEVAESLWVAPAVALAQSESGKFPMMPPTKAVLRILDGHKSWQSLRTFYGLG